MRRLALAVVLLAACGSSPAVTTGRWELAPHRAPCVAGNWQTMCLLRREAGSSEPFTLLYDAIDGFTHRWGRSYTLDVETTPIETPLPDQGSEEYRLLATVRDEPVADGHAFTVTLFSPGPGWLPFAERTGDTTGRFMDETPFDCASALVCAELAQVLHDEAEADLSMRFRIGEAITLELVEVERI
jgi:hypothetical protein